MFFSAFQIVSSLILLTLIVILSIFNGGDIYRKGLSTIGEVSISEDLKRLKGAYYYIHNEGLIISEHDEFVKKVIEMKLLPRYPDYNGMTYIFKKTEDKNPLIFFVLRGYGTGGQTGVSDEICSKINKKFFGFYQSLKISSPSTPYIDTKSNIEKIFSIAANSSISKESVIDINAGLDKKSFDSSTVCFDISGERSVYLVINPSSFGK